MMEYADQFENIEFSAFGDTKILTKTKLNQLCKIASTVGRNSSMSKYNQRFILNHIELDCQTKFSKLISSIYSFRQLWIWHCNFTFNGNLKIDESWSYALTSAFLSKLTFTSNAFKSLLKAFIHISKSTKFELCLRSITINTIDEYLTSLCNELSIPFEITGNSVIYISAKLLVFDFENKL